MYLLCAKGRRCGQSRGNVSSLWHLVNTDAGGSLTPNLTMVKGGLADFNKALVHDKMT